MAQRLVFILLSFFTLVSMQGQDSWTLQRCINYALQNNLSIQQSKIQSEIAHENYHQTFWSTVPNLNAGAGHGYNWGQAIDPFTNTFATERVRNNNFFVRSSVLLFGGLQVQNDIKSRKLDHEASIYDIRRMENDISLTLAGSFLNVMVAEELVGVAQNQLNATKFQVDRMQKLVDAGQFAIGSLYDIQSQYAIDELTLVNRQNDLTNAILIVTQLLQLDAVESNNFKIEVPQLDEVDEQLPAGSVNELYISARDRLPEIKASELRLQSTERQVLAAKGQHSPNISMSGSVGSGYSGASKIGVNPVDITEVVTIGEVEGTGQAVINEFTQTIYQSIETKDFKDQLDDNFNQSLSFNLSIPIFNGFSTRSNVQRAKLSQEIARLNQLQTENAVFQNVQNAYTNALASLNRYRAANKSIQALRENFRYAEKRFDQQIISAVDFNDAKTRLQIGESELIQSKYEFIFRKKIIEFYQGRDITLSQ